MVKLGKAAPEANVLLRARELASSAGGRSDQGEESQPGNPLLQRLQVIAVERIRPGRYQTREQIDPEKFDQLVFQIESEGFRHILFVCHDPEDSNFFNPTQGGHIRLQAAQKAHVGEIICFIEDYSAERLAKGTYFENEGRQDYNIVEKGRLFKKFKADFGWTQERIAEELKVAGGRSHVANCMLAADDPPDIQQMLMKDPTRGFRVVTYLRQLNALDEGEGNQGKAAAARAPIIEAYESGQYNTDEIKVAVDQVLKPKLHAPRMTMPSTLPPLDEGSIRITDRLNTWEKSWKRLVAVVGEAAPSEEARGKLEEARRKLAAMQEEIDQLLARQ